MGKGYINNIVQLTKHLLWVSFLFFNVFHHLGLEHYISYILWSLWWLNWWNLHNRMQLIYNYKSNNGHGLKGSSKRCQSCYEITYKELMKLIHKQIRCFWLFSFDSCFHFSIQSAFCHFWIYRNTRDSNRLNGLLLKENIDILENYAFWWVRIAGKSHSNICLVKVSLIEHKDWRHSTFVVGIKHWKVK